MNNELEGLMLQRKELEQERVIANDIACVLETKFNELEKSNQEFETRLLNESKKIKELEQEKIIFSEVFQAKNESLQHLKKYIVLAIGVIVISGGLICQLDFEHQDSIKPILHMQGNYNSNYVIQNLQGDTVDTWVSWNIPKDRILHIHIVNTANLSQDKINIIKDVIQSTQAVSIDDSLNDKGPKGTSSTYYLGWQGAAAAAYSEPTKMYIPQQFDIDGSPNAVGDIELILTNDVNPDGLSGYTKSMTDNHQILKSKITIYQADKIPTDWLAAVVRHEFGHALGLGHSTANEDLMNGMIQTNYPFVSECDVDALKGLYDGDENSKVVCKK